MHPKLPEDDKASMSIIKVKRTSILKKSRDRGGLDSSEHSVSTISSTVSSNSNSRVSFKLPNEPAAPRRVSEGDVAPLARGVPRHAPDDLLDAFDDIMSDYKDPYRTRRTRIMQKQRSSRISC